MSKFALQKWEPILACFRSFAKVDELYVQLWDYPETAVSTVRSLNPKWVVSVHTDGSHNPQINIWNARCSLLRLFAEAETDFGLLIDDDILLQGELCEIPRLEGTLLALRSGHRPYESWELGYMESGLIMPRELVREILDDYSVKPVAHDDRFLFLLAYLYGFQVESIKSCITHHLDHREKNGYYSWTYADKASDGLLPYGDFTGYVVPGILGIPGKPRLNERGIARAQSARRQRTQTK